MTLDLAKKARALHAKMMKLPRASEWKSRTVSANATELASHLPPDKSKLFLELLNGTIPGPPLTLADLGYGPSDYCSHRKEALKALSDNAQQADVLKVIEKGLRVGAFSRPFDFVEGDKFGGNVIIPQAGFLVRQASKPDKPRQVTDLSRKPDREFDLVDVIARHPDKEEWLRDLYARTRGKPSANDLYMKYDTTMAYSSLKDTTTAFMARRDPYAVLRDWSSWYNQIPNNPSQVYLGLKTFAYRDAKGNIIFVQALLHTLEMGSAPACWKGDTLNNLTYEAWSRKNAKTPLTMQDPLTASDWGLYPGLTPARSKKTRNRRELVHWEGIAYRNFREGTNAGKPASAVYQDDALTTTEGPANAVLASHLIDSEALNQNILASIRPPPSAEAEFRGYNWDGTEYEIEWTAGKRQRLQTLHDKIRKAGRASGTEILTWTGSLGHLTEIFPDVKHLHAQMAFWLGALGKKCHSVVPRECRKKWRDAKAEIYEVPDEIISTAVATMRATEGRTRKMINLVLDPLDAIIEDGDTHEGIKATWTPPPHLNLIHAIFAKAAEEKRRANVFSIDASMYGCATVAHGWGPRPTPEEKARGIFRWGPGDFFMVRWREIQEFIKQFAEMNDAGLRNIRSTAFETIGYILFLISPWAARIRAAGGRAKQHGAKPVVTIFSDCTGAIAVGNKGKIAKGYIGPALMYQKRVRESGLELKYLYCSTDVIPADAPTRTDLPHWEANLKSRCKTLHLDLRALGKCHDPPPGWKKELFDIIGLQRRYSRFCATRRRAGNHASTPVSCEVAPALKASRARVSRAVRSERRRMNATRVSHKTGTVLIRQYAQEVQKYDVIDRDGHIRGNHPEATEELENFIYWAASKRTASQMGKIFAGAMNVSWMDGTLSRMNLAPHRRLVTRYRKSHVPGPKVAIPQKDFSEFLVKASSLIFGPPGGRLSVLQTIEGDVNNWLIAVARYELYVRPSELVDKVQHPDDQECQFRISEHVIEYSDPEYMALKRPTKVLRQKRSRNKEIIPFRRDFRTTDTIVGIAETIAHIVKKAIESGRAESLREPLKMDTPKGFKKRVPITTSAHTAWQRNLARRIGFRDDIALLFTCRNTRRTNMTSAVNTARNPILASKMTRHASPNTTSGYYVPSTADLVTGREDVLNRLIGTVTGTSDVIDLLTRH